jgi:hypothetical protein
LKNTQTEPPCTEPDTEVYRKYLVEGQPVRVVGRWIAFALLLVPVIAAGAIAQPEPAPFPPAPPAREKAEKGAKLDDEDLSAQRAKLQADLLALLKTLNARGPVPPMGPPMTSPKGKTDYPPPEPGKSIDQVREGMNLFRDNYFEAARRTFYAIDPATLNREDRVFVRYMYACSLRRVGKIAEAEVVYREVANNPDDDFLASCAISQLSLIRSNADLEAQLEQLRSRTKSK